MLQQNTKGQKMLSGTPVELLRKHVNGEFQRDVRSMNILWDMIMKDYTELLLIHCMIIDAGEPAEALMFEHDLNELSDALSWAWKI